LGGLSKGGDRPAPAFGPLNRRPGAFLLFLIAASSPENDDGFPEKIKNGAMTS
jgi:hypothetical protein